MVNRYWGMRFCRLILRGRLDVIMVFSEPADRRWEDMLVQKAYSPHALPATVGLRRPSDKALSAIDRPGMDELQKQSGAGRPTLQHCTERYRIAVKKSSCDGCA